MYTGKGGSDFNFNPRLLFEYAIQRDPYIGFEIEHKFVVGDEDKKKKYTKLYGDKFLNLTGFKDSVEIWRSIMWVTPSRPIYLNPLSAMMTNYVNVWHGIPLKRIGLSDKYANLGARIRYKFYGKIAKYIIAPSKTFSPIFAAAFGVSEKKIKICGSPVVEFLSDKTLKRLEGIKLDEDKFNILYAPTYRDNGMAKVCLSSIIDRSILNKNVRDRKIKIYMRPHGLDSSDKDNTIFEYLTRETIDEISYNCDKFDLIISDYSSVGVDCLGARMPVIQFCPDLQEYAFKRGFSLDTNEIIYTKKIETQEDLIKIISDDVCENIENVNIKKFHINRRDTCKKFFEEMYCVISSNFGVQRG